MSEIPDWLRAMVNQTLTPGDMADADQKIAEGKKAAIEILVQYLNFCIAVDHEEEDQAIVASLQVQLLLAKMQKQATFFAMVYMCDLLAQELILRHGGTDKLAEAAVRGDLFLANSQEASEEYSTLARLEKDL